jgi:hypothetical protein
MLMDARQFSRSSERSAASDALIAKMDMLDSNSLMGSTQFLDLIASMNTLDVRIRTISLNRV